MRTAAVVAALTTAVAAGTAGTAHAATAIATPGQHAYVVMVNDTSGTDSYPDSQSVILARIDTVLARWVTESDHLISSVTRAGSVQSFDADCSQSSAYSAAWDASGTLFPGVSFTGTSGNHLVVVAPEGCGGGIGQEGSDTNGLSSGGKVYIDDNPSKGTQSLLHELGHNFSLQHAHAVSCDTSGSCTQPDYGDDYAIMGTTEEHTPAFVPASFDSFERTHLGIAQPCEIPTLALAAGQRQVTATYDLFGRGSTSTGVRGLALTDPVSGVRTMLDWRDHAGRDADAYYGSSLADAQREDFNTGLTVEQVASDGDSTILQGHLADGKTYAATSAGTYLHAYTAGQTYTADGTSVQVDAMPAGNGTDATTQVTVTLTGSQSADGPSLPTQSGGVTASGDPTAGSTLTAVPSSWTAGSCFRYQWYDDGVAIDGARSGTYVVPSSAVGHQLTVAVTGQQTGYQPLTVTSRPAATPVVPPTSAAPTTTTPGSPGGGSSGGVSGSTMTASPLPTAAGPAVGALLEAPGFSRAVLHVGDRTATATYAVSNHGTRAALTFSAAARGHRTVTSTTTLQQGSLALRGLTDGVRYTYSLTATSLAGSSTTTLGRQAPARIPSLTLRARGEGGSVTLTGTLLNGRSGVANRVVTLTAVVGGHTVTVARLRTDRHGRFGITVQPTGISTLAAAASFTLDNGRVFRGRSRGVRVG